MKHIDSLELKKRMDAGEALYLLDIREPYEREIGHIASVHIPMADVPAHAAGFPTSEEIIVICRSGRRAEAVANLLMHDFKLANVTILDGGLLGWKDQVDPSLNLE